MSINQHWKLEGKAILVTGSNRGIGKGVALELGRAGASVGVTFSGSESGKEKAAEVCEQIQSLGGRATMIALNVADEAQCKEAVGQMTSEFGGLYGLVNNAGVAIDQLTLRYKMEDWDQVFDTNLKGSFQLAKLALRPLMKNREGASIVNMSSVVGLSGNAGQAPYSASKAGLIGLTKSLALEFASRKIRVNAVAPGFIETEMTAALTQDQQTKITEQIPMQQMGSVEDIAAATAYLLSPLSQYVTGQVLSVNGGLYM